MSKIIGIIGLFLLVSITQGRKHNLVLESDGRRVITLTTFGFLQKGTLKVNVSSFAYQLIPFESHQNLKNINRNGQIGFTLSKTDNTGGNAYLENFKKNCTLTPGVIYGSEAEAKKDSINLILFTLDFDKQMLNILRIGKDVANIEVRGPSAQIVSKTARARKRSVPSLGERLSDSFLYAPLRRRREAKVTTTTTPTTTTAAVETTTASASETSSSSVSKTEAAPAGETTAPKVTTTSTAPTQKKNTDKPQKPSGSVKPKPQELIKRIPISRERKDKADVFHFMFEVTINKEMEEGLYHLFMHNCLGGSKLTNPQYFGTQINLSVHIEENNSGNYLSAGEMPLPTLYFVLCCVFFAMGGIWLAVLRRARDDVYKIHFLMLTVVCLKSLSLLFHAIHFHFIEVKGTQAEAWAVLYYIAYLMKVTLLFLTILLIGAGWAFVKHMLSEKEKKLFIIFIPLQILANVAFIIVEESEEGTAVYTTWKEIFILVDLLCCGAILFPVVWSIRHLTEASHTDGKAAMNLNKLKLFRHFYMLVVCYIYFTRIIVYLLQITVPFKYSWLDELFKQAAILLFFVVTGSKFRPAPDNPYLQVPTDSDDEVEMEEVLTKPGVLETVVKVNQYNSERETTTANKRESSHEYD